MTHKILTKLLLFVTILTIQTACQTDKSTQASQTNSLDAISTEGLMISNELTLCRIDETLSGTTLLKELTLLLKNGSDSKEETKALALLKNASMVDLNFALQTLNIEEDIIDGIDNHFAGQKNKDALFEILGTTQAKNINICHKATIIHLLAEGTTDKDDEILAKQLILSTKGIKLSYLKSRIDASGDHHDLLHLIEHDIDEEEIQNDIRTHITQEAQEAQPSFIKVLSDIDDTIYASVNDERYPNNTVYPGAINLYRALSQFSSLEKNDFEESFRPIVTFLSARPDERSGQFADYNHEKMRSFGVSKASFLLGDIFHLINEDDLLDKKIENYQLFQSIYPEFKKVFIGDSGQKDAHLAEYIRTQFPNSMPFALIHNINDISSERRAELLSKNIYLFNNYAEASLICYQNGLISAEQLKLLAEKITPEFENIEFDNSIQKSSLKEELETELQKIEEILGS